MTAPLQVRATQNNPLGAVLGAADRPRPTSPSQPPLCRPAPIFALPLVLPAPAGRNLGRPRPGRTTEGLLSNGRARSRVGSTGQPPEGLCAVRPACRKVHVRGCRPPPPDWRAFCRVSQSQTPRLRLLHGVSQPKVQLLTVDHSARGSMKTAANCVS